MSYDWYLEQNAKKSAPMNSKLRTALNNYKKAITDDSGTAWQQEESITEAEKAIRKAVASEMLGLADSSQPDLDFERINDERYTVESAYNQALYDYQTELVKTIKEWRVA